MAFIGRKIYYHKWRGKTTYELFEVLRYNQIKRTFKIESCDGEHKQSDMQIEHQPFYLADEMIASKLPECIEIRSIQNRNADDLL